MLRTAVTNGNYLYLIREIRENKGKYYLDVYNVTDLNSIKMVSRYETGKELEAIQVMGDYVILNEGGEIVILRVSG